MNWSKYINEEEIKAVEAAVKKAEKKTAGEIVPVLVSVSDTYPEVPFRVAAVGMILVWICLVVLKILDFDLTFAAILPIWSSGRSFLLNSELVIYLATTIFGFAAGYISAAFIPGIRRIFLSKKRIDEEVRQAAIETFLDSNIHLTEKHSGILIYVTLFERRVEIVADKGINDAIGEEPVWQALAERLALDIKQGKAAGGLLKAVEDCGVLLANKFPRGLINKNELPDQLQLKD